MEDPVFSDAFCRFLQTSVPSVETAEILLLLLKERERWWAAPEVVEQLKRSITLSEAEAAKHLELLHARSLAAADQKRYQYRPASNELDAFVQTLGLAYNERPVTLIRLIYALRDTKIQSFADAFKVRK